MPLIESIKFVGAVAEEVGKTADLIGQAVKKVDKALDEVISVIDTSHTVSIKVVNLTDINFEYLDTDHSHGKWADIASLGFDVFPAPLLGARQVMGCVTQDSGFWTGTKGILQYRYIQPGDTGYYVAGIVWDNPAVFWAGNRAQGFATYIDTAPVAADGSPVDLDPDLFRLTGDRTTGDQMKAVYYIFPEDVSEIDATQIRTSLSPLTLS